MRSGDSQGANDTHNVGFEQYLIFKLAGQEYALNIMQVREIVEYAAVTKVPRTPASMHGVINLRGNVVPVLELSAILGVPAHPRNSRTCIIVVEVNSEHECAVMGIVADTVSRVTQWPIGEILPPPAFGVTLRVDFLKGMTKSAVGLVILLDINKVLASAELDASASNDL